MQLGVHTCVWNAIAYSSACRTPFLVAKMYSTRWYVVLAFQLNVFRLHRHKTVTPTELDLIDSERFPAPLAIHLWPSTSSSYSSSCLLVASILPSMSHYYRDAVFYYSALFTLFPILFACAADWIPSFPGASKI